ncbi:MAG: CBS domain-containing protein [Gammaproteobacteria bacterium]
MKTPQPRLASTMTPFPYSVDLDAPLAEAKRMIATHYFHHLPVTAGANIVGIVHCEDLGADDSGFVRDHYRPDVYVVDIETPLSDVLVNMAEQHVDAAVVMRHDRLAGVFTTTDACRAFAALLSELWPDPVDDWVA